MLGAPNIEMVTKRSPETEEYLELLVRYKEAKKQPKAKMLSGDLGVSAASVSEMLQKLAKKGLVDYKKYGEIKLTKKGEKVGKEILRKHRFIEKFLVRIGMKKSKVHKEACVLEHVLSDDVEEALEKAMRAPGALKIEKSNIKRLVDLKKNENGIIVLVSGGAQACRRLTDMGLTPGTKVTLNRASSKVGALEVCIRSSCLAIGRGLAEKILVRVKK